MPLSWNGACLPQEQAHRHPGWPSSALGFVGACSMLQPPLKRLTPRHGGVKGGKWGRVRGGDSQV